MGELHMAKLNLEFYNGEDIYNDGTVEEQLLNHYKNKTPLDFHKDNVFYLTTDIRSNILNWYPFESNAEVLEIGCGCGTLTGMLCEKCKKVTCVEGSKRRAEITYYRHQDKENLEVYAGNFDDIRLDKKFDYIILIGVFEYAKMFFQSKTPFDDFLAKIKGMLSSKGKVLLAIENRYGIKYWAGANEDHLIKPYVGLEGYDSYSVQTFGKQEFIQMIERHGFYKNKFYYPFPDYKLPTIVYTDDRLPRANEISTIPIYPYGSRINFDVHQVLSGLIDNDSFGFFSNSFLIEFGAKDVTLSDVIYARNLSYRHSDFKTITIENAQHEIIKVGANSIVRKHLDELVKNHENLKTLHIPACHIEKKNSIYQIERIDGYNVAEYIQKLVIDGDWDAVFAEVERLIEYYKSISTKKKISNPIIKEINKVYRRETFVLKLSLFDGNASNIIRDKDGNYILIDQEWVHDRELPMDYLVYHSLAYIWGTCPLLQNTYPVSDIYDKYGITDSKMDLFYKIEQSYFTSIKEVIDLETKKILNDCSQSFEANSISKLNVLYYDIGDGFNEKNKIIGEYKSLGDDLYEVNYVLPKSVTKVRFDPLITGNKLVWFDEVQVNHRNAIYEEHNILKMGNKKSLCKQYPFIVFPFHESHLKIVLKLVKFTESEVEAFVQSYSNLVCDMDELKSQMESLTQRVKDQEQQLFQIRNSKGWKLLEKIRKIKNR